jgi:hypothetical protein
LQAVVLDVAARLALIARAGFAGRNFRPEFLPFFAD